MGFFKRVAGFLGIGKDDLHEVKDEEVNDVADEVDSVFVSNHPQRKGFSVPVQVAVERPQLGPILLPCIVGQGGVQGLRWWAQRLRIDEDGDVADEFLDEVLPETTLPTTEVHYKESPKFEVKYNTKPAKVKYQALSPDGKIQQFVEYQGQLLLV